MPVILNTQAKREELLSAPASEIERLQARVLPTDALEIVGDVEAYVGN